MIAPLVVAAFREEAEVQPVKQPDWAIFVRGILTSDEYFARVRPSAGIRDWQRDLPQVATPTLVGVAQVLERSGDAHAVILRLCDVIARRLRVKITWPTDADDFNDLTNAIYAACLRATDVESDDVLVQLKSLTIIGPA